MQIPRSASYPLIANISLLSLYFKKESNKQKPMRWKNATGAWEKIKTNRYIYIRCNVVIQGNGIEDHRWNIGLCQHHNALSPPHKVHIVIKTDKNTTVNLTSNEIQWPTLIVQDIYVCVYLQMSGSYSMHVHTEGKWHHNSGFSALTTSNPEVER